MFSSRRVVRLVGLSEEGRGMRRGLVAAACMVVVAGVGAVPAAAAGVLDQSQVASDDVLYIAPASDDSLPSHAAQTFIPAVTGSIDRVDLPLRRAPYDMRHVEALEVTVSRWTDLDDPEPARNSSVSLASVSVPISEISAGPTPEWISVRFDRPAALTAGDRYAIELGVSDESSFMFGVGVADDDPYPRGNLWSYSWHSGSWSSRANTDMAFKTYVIPSAPTSKAACKAGGWRSYGSMFKNQGACMRSVTRDGDRGQTRSSGPRPREMHSAASDSAAATSATSSSRTRARSAISAPSRSAQPTPRAYSAVRPALTPTRGSGRPPAYAGAERPSRRRGRHART